MSKKLNFSYDEVRDQLTIEGIVYSGAFFRALSGKGLNLNQPFEIEKREDGVITFRTLDKSPSEKLALVLSADQVVVDEVIWVLKNYCISLEDLHGFLKLIGEVSHSGIDVKKAAEGLKTTMDKLEQKKAVNKKSGE